MLREQQLEQQRQQQKKYLRRYDSAPVSVMRTAAGTPKKQGCDARKKSTSGSRALGAVWSFVKNKRSSINAKRATTPQTEGESDGSPASQTSFFSGRTGCSDGSSGSSSPVRPGEPLHLSKGKKYDKKKGCAGGDVGGRSSSSRGVGFADTDCPSAGSNRSLDSSASNNSTEDNSVSSGRSTTSNNSFTNGADRGEDCYLSSPSDSGSASGDVSGRDSPDHDCLSDTSVMADHPKSAPQERPALPASYKTLPPFYQALCLPPHVAAATAPSEEAGKCGQNSHHPTGPSTGKSHILKRGTVHPEVVSRPEVSSRSSVNSSGDRGRTDLRRRSSRTRDSRDSRDSRSRDDRGRSKSSSQGGSRSEQRSVARDSSHASAAEKAVHAASGGQHSSRVPVQGSTGSTHTQRKVAVHPMEKDFIRSLAEIEDEVWTDNTAPPLLSPRLQSSPADWPSATSGCDPTVKSTRDSADVADASDAATMTVSAGPRKTLVLDLDETLVSSSRKPCSCDYKIVFKIHYREGASDDTFAANADANSGPASAPGNGKGNVHGNGNDKGRADEGEESVREICYFVRIRPGVAKFLEKVATMYELVVWTASGRSYADAIIDLLDPHDTLFSRRLYRDSCVRHRGLCVKDLRRLGRPMNTVLLLDNYVYSFGFNLDNGVPISPWTGMEEAKDSGLAVAFALLKYVVGLPDVRAPLITAFDLHKRIYGVRSPPSPAPSPISSAASSPSTVFRVRRRVASFTAHTPVEDETPGMEELTEHSVPRGKDGATEIVTNASLTMPAVADATLRREGDTMAARSAALIAAVQRGFDDDEDDGESSDTAEAMAVALE